MVPSYSRKAISGWSNYPGTVTSHMMNENEMGYRGSKSVSQLCEDVKEQRVDGSYCINSAQRLQSNLVGMQLRCTLMGFERNYQFKIPSNQLNKALFSTSIQDPKLNPWFVSGLTDAE
jgi:hypothetical protein